jgi:hypothetical protein
VGSRVAGGANRGDRTFTGAICPVALSTRPSIWSVAAPAPSENVCAQTKKRLPFAATATTGPVESKPWAFVPAGERACGFPSLPEGEIVRSHTVAQHTVEFSLGATAQVIVTSPALSATTLPAMMYLLALSLAIATGRRSAPSAVACWT